MFKVGSWMFQVSNYPQFAPFADTTLPAPSGPLPLSVFIRVHLWFLRFLDVGCRNSYLDKSHAGYTLSKPSDTRSAGYLHTFDFL